MSALGGRRLAVLLVVIVVLPLLLLSPSRICIISCFASCVIACAERYWVSKRKKVAAHRLVSKSFEHIDASITLFYRV